LELLPPPPLLPPAGADELLLPLPFELHAASIIAPAAPTASRRVTFVSMRFLAFPRVGWWSGVG
jgi:hypothetical protein